MAAPSEWSASSARHSAGMNIVAYGAPSGANAIIPHLAALVDHSRTLEPAEFAIALASSKSVTAHELDRLLEWLTTSARELGRFAAGMIGNGAEPDAEG